MASFSRWVASLFLVGGTLSVPAKQDATAVACAALAVAWFLASFVAEFIARRAQAERPSPPHHPE